MDPQDAVDLAREALFVALIISSPALAAGLIVGLGMGLLQALTQIQDQTVAFVPKILAMVVALAFTLPWLLNQFLDYCSEIFSGLANRL
jgi:flagellar biosynthetic protein FliQ